MTEQLPATIGDRRLFMPLIWPGHGQVPIWLTPDEDFAVEATVLVRLLDITDASTYRTFRIDWVHEWTPPPTRMLATAYLWSRETALAAARALAGDAAVGEAFAKWIGDQHRDLCLRDWEGTLDMLLPKSTGARNGVEYSISSAAGHLVDLLGVAVTRDELFSHLQRIGWIKRTSTNGYRATFLARALDVAFSRNRKLPGNAGTYEQPFLTSEGLARLTEQMREQIEGETSHA